MKLNQSLIPILLLGLINFQYPTDKILINGKIIGILPKNVEHTSSINRICNWWFVESV